VTLSISSSFDAGNIKVVSAGASSADLEIRRDHQSDFYQWFHFRVSGAISQQVELRILNCAGSAYPQGWPGYTALASADRQQWLRTPTRYEDGVLTITHTLTSGVAWFAYFTPYSLERHQDLVAATAMAPGVRLESLGQTLDGRDIDLLTVGEGPLKLWLYARQHPGETMAEYWMEGALSRLTDPADPVARLLRRKASFHIVPNMNPDGSFRGHLRTNAAGVNLNREWHAPTLERSPEVYHVLERMKQIGVDFAIDVHGDESIPHVFLAGFEGIPNWKDEQGALYRRYVETLARISPDFQTRHGYPPAPPGRANLSMSTNALANRFGCVSMTLEMPFKDNLDLADPAHGWSAGRSRALGRDCLAALHEIIDDLR